MKLNDTQKYMVDALIFEMYEGSDEGEEVKNDFDPFGHLDITPEESSSVDEVIEDCILGFSKGNKKLNHPYLSLPAGYSCPFAKDCLSKASRDGSEFEDGKKIKDFGQFRCYAASAEVQYKNVRENRWRNFDLLQGKSSEKMAEIILNSFKYNFPDGINVFRIHESGDFFNQNYFDAWIKVAKMLPGTIFYAYTKSIPYWIKRIGQIPDNLILNASKGGRYDDTIDDFDLKFVEVVYSPEEAAEKGLNIDIDDSLAWKQSKSFAQLLHGSQSAGSEEGKASRKNSKTLKDVKKRMGLSEQVARSITKIIKQKMGTN